MLVKPKDAIPPKLRSSYYKKTLVLDTVSNSYLTFQAISKATQEHHTIRVLNLTLPTVTSTQYDIAATLFIKELSRLYALDPRAILIESFEISDGKIGFASLSHFNSTDTAGFDLMPLLDSKFKKSSNISESTCESSPGVFSKHVPNFPEIENLRASFQELRAELSTNPIEQPLSQEKIEIEHNPSLFGWCSQNENLISLFDFQKDQEYATFPGVRLTRSKFMGSSFVNSIPNTNLLVSSYQSKRSATMAIFNRSNKNKIHKVFAFEEIEGGSGESDFAYCSRRSLMAMMSVTKKYLFHLFEINYGASGLVSLRKKARWQLAHKGEISNLDFEPSGAIVTSIDIEGNCVLTDVNSNDCKYHLILQLRFRPDLYARCRWSVISGDPTLFVKYEMSKLNMFDIEKKMFSLTTPLQLHSEKGVRTIDLCPSDGNLVAAGDDDGRIQIFDRRVPNIVTSCGKGLHSFNISSIKWTPKGDMLGTCSWDTSAKVIDIKTWKPIFSKNTPKRGLATSACFIGK